VENLSLPTTYLIFVVFIYCANRKRYFSFGRAIYAELDFYLLNRLKGNLCSEFPCTLFAKKIFVILRVSQTFDEVIKCLDGEEFVFILILNFCRVVFK
jgi:hypothetical protein